ncbi:hypothetical protein, partial [Okeania sp. SIO3B5]|uniref:hypothetical protein n=1 Tax=Okeania sp. SIO3B5 TaxID=2607811 RepID=UPI0025F8CCDF
QESGVRSQEGRKKKKEKVFLSLIIRTLYKIVNLNFLRNAPQTEFRILNFLRNAPQTEFRIQKGRELRIISALGEDGTFFYTELNRFDINSKF